MPRKKKQYIQLKIQLRDEHPPVWRRVVVPRHFALNQLHAVIQIAFGWENSHLYQFWATQNKKTFYVPQIDSDFYANQKPTQGTEAVRLLEKSNLIYEYDFGESWEHLIHLEKVLGPADLNGEQAPFCLTGRGAGKQEDSRGEADNDATPFDKAAINTRLHAAFPTEMAMPDDYQYDQAPIWSTDSAARQLQNDPKLMDALLAGKTIVQDGDNPPEIKNPQPARTTKSAHAAKAAMLSDKVVAQAVEELSMTANDRTLHSVTVLNRAIHLGTITNAQLVTIAKRIINDQLLHYHIQGERIADGIVRMSVGRVVRHLLMRDDQQPFLPAPVRTALFNEITDAAIQETNVVYFQGDVSGVAAALNTYGVMLYHPDYPAFANAADVTQNESAVVLQVLAHIEGAFNSGEIDAMANIFYALAETGQMAPPNLTTHLKLVSSALELNVKRAPADDLLPRIRQRMWENVLALLDIALRDFRAYRSTQQYVHGLVKQRLANTLAIDGDIKI
ncbi:plasmid pRiA4b ORF-3 family protein [Schleiferilactobacillus harbinensis]|uniref:plasmid pRiA4b ORF-3 family protein n=1 Tax=Schleiferilactobacillus harbinensis TaxID=304207 RepID=UPI001AAF6DF3|nr:plasmid pRiA4b ORF-3 family protein [Schleiferilactobacillus harbinensis]MBO3092447.1 plasmid pRiA4b ORF-3 family protein [Schleiferilactobacillus harbinensis]